jgi:hypothetical protein
MDEGMRLWRRGRICGLGNAAEEAGRPPCRRGRHCARRGANVALGLPLAQDAPM